MRPGLVREWGSARGDLGRLESEGCNSWGTNLHLPQPTLQVLAWKLLERAVFAPVLG